MTAQNPLRKPPWLKVKLPGGENYHRVLSQKQQQGLTTVCEEANCPNQGECWKTGTATFMLLGEFCTRACRFCAVATKNRPPAPDSNEPIKLARTVKSLELDYVVLTTVDRDDLKDQGALHIAKCITTCRLENPEVKIEALVPDFQGDVELMKIVLEAKPDVIGHNVETVMRLTPEVRDPRAGYEQSLSVLKFCSNYSDRIYTKSSIMIGLGETEDEILQTMRDIKSQGVELLTLGQYLQPNKAKLPVLRYWTPEEFVFFQEKGEDMGFKQVASGPLVRSSYKASELFVMMNPKNG